MNRSLRVSLCLVVGLCVVDGIGLWRGKHASAQFGARDDETPQRMCVGIIENGVVVGFERTRGIRQPEQKEYNTLNWYEGHLGADGIAPSDLRTSEMEGRTSTMLRRWGRANGRLWLAFEASYGPFGGSVPRLLRTKPLAEIDGAPLSLDQPIDVDSHPDQKVWIEACEPETMPFNAAAKIERLSHLKPLTGTVGPSCADWNHDRTSGLFDHRTGGFDIIHHGLDHWTLFMTVGHTMQIWECRSKRVATEEGDEIQNTWTLVTELCVPWTGQFFVFERIHLNEYVVVRDCGEVHLLRLEWEPMRPRPKLTQGTRWRGRQLLDPVDYLIALIYIAPENTVYGFGPNFYVRLATANLKWEQRAIALKKVSCRDVTKGKAIWTDAHGESHEVGEPFRTIWQCAQVLKADGVLK